MNYLSHYFLDNRYNQPYFNFGLALPDLMGTANRRWKPQRINSKTFSTESANLWKGIERHLRADAVFHNSSYFKENTRTIRILLEQNGLKNRGPRLFFLAHIIFELLLDRLILKSWPGVADRFYSDLITVEESIIRHELENCILPDYGPFFEHLSRFCRSRYLYNYLEDEKILFAVKRIMTNAGQQGINEAYEEALLNSILQAEKNINAGFLSFFDSMYPEE